MKKKHKFDFKLWKAWYSTHWIKLWNVKCHAQTKDIRVFAQTNSQAFIIITCRCRDGGQLLTWYSFLLVSKLSGVCSLKFVYNWYFCHKFAYFLNFLFWTIFLLQTVLVVSTILIYLNCNFNSFFAFDILTENYANSFFIWNDWVFVRRIKSNETCVSVLSQGVVPHGHQEKCLVSYHSYIL